MNEQTLQEEKVKKECVHAVEGERVWVLLNHVKPDRRKEFERFMHEIVGPICTRTEPHVLLRTRILNPTEPNEDGTYTYIFLVDPYVPDGEYNFDEILRQAYSAEESDEIVKLFSESLASPQVGYEVTQVAW